MFSWFKRKEQSGAAMGAELVGLAFAVVPSTVPFPDVDGMRVRREIACASLFAVDFGLSQALGTSPSTVRLTEEFWRAAEQRPVETYGPVVADARARFPEYLRALQNPGPKGVSFEVGNVVARLAGAEGHPAVILLAARGFIATLTAVKETFAGSYS